MRLLRRSFKVLPRNDGRHASLNKMASLAKLNLR